MSVKLLGINILRVDTTAKHEPGLVVYDVRGGQGLKTASDVLPATGAAVAGPSVQTILTQLLDGAAEFKYIKAGSAIAPGDLIILDTSVPDGTQAIPSSAVSQPVLGVAIPTEASYSGTPLVSIPSGSYGWVQIKGFVRSNTTTAPFYGLKVTANGAAGNQLASSATATKAVQITSAGPSNAEVIAAIANGTGVGIVQLVAGASDGTTSRAACYIY
jgi:hypothetical protein